jgi:hypothetical protein
MNAPQTPPTPDPKAVMIQMLNQVLLDHLRYQVLLDPSVVMGPLRGAR